MSNISSLVLVLLCFYFHACNARSFGVLHHMNTKENSISKIKNEKLINPARVSTQPNATKYAKQENRFEKEKMSNGESDEPGKHDIEAKDDEESIKVSEYSRHDESLTSVSWRVPHKKKGEKEPGFNLDYLPPKTHPPVHN